MQTSTDDRLLLMADRVEIDVRRGSLSDEAMLGAPEVASGTEAS
jgi:hypothetical protein